MHYTVDGIRFYFCRFCDSWVTDEDHTDATPAQVAEIKRQRDEESDATSWC